MGKISDALREWVSRARADEHMSLRELDNIADRIRKLAEREASNERLRARA